MGVSHQALPRYRSFPAVSMAKRRLQQPHPMADVDGPPDGEGQNAKDAGAGEDEGKGKSLLGSGPILIPAQKCGPGDIRSVLFQEFSDLYEVDMKDKEEMAKETKCEQQKDEDGAEQKDEAAKGEEQAGDMMAKANEEEAKVVDEKVEAIKRSLKSTLEQSKRMQKLLEERHSAELQNQHQITRALQENWGLITGVDIPMPSRVVEEGNLRYLPTIDDEEAAGLVEGSRIGFASAGRGESKDTKAGSGERKVKELDEVASAILDLGSIMRQTEKERKEFTRQRMRSPPPGSHTRKAALPPLEDTHATMGFTAAPRDGERNQYGETTLKMSASLSTSTFKRKVATQTAKEIKMKRKMKTLLRKMPRGDQVADEKRVLERMSRKLNFLKNPRFAAPGTSSTLSYSTAKVAGRTVDGMLGGHPIDALTCDPTAVLFDAYEPGSTYTAKVRVTNRSALSRRIKILPPSTKFFNTKQAKFPGLQGMVAPGMQITITVSFTPNSLAPFEDAFTVWADSGSITIPLWGQRPPPILDLKPHLHCEVCLIGATSTVSQIVTNTGGYGRFWVFPKTSRKKYPTMKDVENLTEGGQTGFPASVQVGKFMISPGSFELRPRGKIKLTVSFSSENLAQESQSFVLLCDNHTKTQHLLTGKAMDLQLALSNVTGAKNFEPEVCSLKAALPSRKSVKLQPGSGKEEDNSTEEGALLPFYAPSSTVNFERSILGGTDVKQITVTNSCPIASKFHWEFPGMPKRSKGQQKAVFTVRPKKGEIGPFEHAKFDFYFRPQDSALQAQLAHLVIDSLPNRFLRVKGASMRRQEQQSDCDVSLPIMGFRLNGQAKPGRVATSPALIYIGPLVIGTKRSADIKVQNSYKFPVYFSFKTPRPTQLDELNDEFKLSLTERSGKLEPHETRTITLTFECKEIGRFDIDLPCQVHKGEVSTIKIRGISIGPTVRCLTPWLEYGPLNFGKKGICQTLPLDLENCSNAPAEVVLENADPAVTPALLGFQPKTVIIKPKTLQRFQVTLFPKSASYLKSHLVVRVKHGKTQYVGVGATVEVPVFKITPSPCLSLSTCFIGVPRKIEFTLKNMTKLAGVYHWEAQDLPEYAIDFEPREGSLLGDGEQKITAHVMPRSAGPLHVLVGCDVEGLTNPIGLEIKGETLPLCVSCHNMHKEDTQNPDVDSSTKRKAMEKWLKKQQGGTGKRYSEREYEKALFERIYPTTEPPPDNKSWCPHVTGSLDVLNFGNNCEIFSQQSSTMVLRNHSGIRTRFSVSLATHLIVDSLPEEKKTTTTSKKSKEEKKKKNSTGGRKKPSLVRSSSMRSRRNLLTETDQNPRLDGSYEEGARFRSEKGQDYIHGFEVTKGRNKILEEAKGIAFCVTPSSGVIEPFGLIRVNVACINNMCGRFTDEMELKIEGMMPKIIPVEIGVMGSPVSFPKDNPGMRWEMGGKRATLAWRDVPLKTGRYTKAISVENKGPVAVQVRWSMHDFRMAQHKGLVNVDIDVLPGNNNDDEKNRDVDAVDEKKDDEGKTASNEATPAPTTGDDCVRLKLKPYSHPEVTGEEKKSYFFSIDKSELIIAPHSRAKMRVTFDSDNVAEEAAQSAAFLQGKLFVKKEDAKLLTPGSGEENSSLKEDINASVNVELIEDSDNDVDEIASSRGDSKMQTVLCDIDRFERQLKRQRNKSAGKGAESPADSKNLSEQQQKDASEAQLSATSPSSSSSSSSSWVPAPAPLDSESLMLSLEARATASIAIVDKRKGNNGKQRVKFVTGPYQDSSSSSSSLVAAPRTTTLGGPARVTALVKTVPVSNRSRSIMQFKVTAEPQDWYRVEYVTDTPGDAEQARSKVLKRILRGKKTKKAGVTFGATTADISDTPHLLEPGEAVHVGVRFVPCPPSDTKRWPVKRTVEKAGALVLNLEGGRKQKIDLKGMMLRPSLELNHTYGKPKAFFTTKAFDFDFGGVFVKMRQSVVLQLRNPTIINAKWRIKHVPRGQSADTSSMKVSTLRDLNLRDFDLDAHTVDDPSVFSFSQMFGEVNARSRAPAVGFATKLDEDINNLVETLRGGKTFADTRPVRMRHDGLEHMNVQARFSPKDTREYLCRYRLEVEHGYPSSIDIELRGCGTLDESKRRS